MCNLYRMTKAAGEVARLFGVGFPQQANTAQEVYPGYPGMVIADGQLQQMHWGFPLALHGKHGQLLKPRPVNNARSDKLSGQFWRGSFEHRRCLIPMSAWAEAEGPKGGKTRTWLSLADGEMCTAAGLWRPSDEWGDVYSMVIVDAGPGVAGVHTRMPALIRPVDRAAFLGGTAREAFDLCRPYDGELLIDRTAQPWAGRAV
ncbi:hypothetical protein SZ64_08340 [Erythrobacter sp. SG61-1L]|uniref:SOS response-associated peptidase n=1 Tax=Erythrobacter sp. SG61-1L TaxID=1603897 RepID=UPI0006C8EC19|nr:SOS response-associated peptidase family protein [Erythrobacter sp. SG61-1L]KPL68126.1 hypothetical protein SZ64_08340 [Erythrobacter sp. SG61-1L]